MLTSTLQSTVLTVGGTTVTYYDSQDNRGSEDVLVLMHGTSGTTASHFGFLFPILSAKQRVLSVDWSQSESGDAPLEIEDFVAQVVGVIEQVVPGRRVMLLGYSLGAVAAAVLAARHPELVGRLILVSGWIKTDLQQILRNNVWMALHQSGNAAAIRDYTMFCAYGGPYLASKTSSDVQPELDRMTFDELGTRQMVLNRSIDIVDDAHRIVAPTLVIGCTHDQMVPIRHQKALFGAIADARFAEIPTGHAVVFERPSELCHHVQRFLDEPAEHAPGTIITVPTP